MGMGKQQITAGDPHTLGAGCDDHGTNFALFSAHAERVELCLYDPTGTTETGRYTLPENNHHVWHGFVPGVKPGDCYGYRVHGAYEPHSGHRFNPHKLLLDPYARQLQGDFSWHDAHFGYARTSAEQDLSFDQADNAQWMPKAVVTAPQHCPQNLGGWTTPWSRTVIYETHVRGFTMLHPDLPENLRGTFAGLSQPQIIDYIKALGISSVELMPVQGFIDEHFLHQKGLRNYWGYNTLSFFAPHAAYLAGSDAMEFRHMVDSFHEAGLEVILDVVYNHTAEGGHLGPTLSFRGIDNASYYRLQPSDNRFYINDTGCGNTLNISHPRVLQLVMDSLRYWVEVMGVDGFRFDLAPILGRDPRGFNQRHGFFQAISQDPLLSRIKLIAEPWDIGPGGYQLGGFPAGWSEWNDRYRDTVRQFWRGDPGVMPEFARRLHGSSDLFEYGGRRPTASINFVASHDGFTVHDLVSYRLRHNLDNGEENRDGHRTNYSENYGVEGPTDIAGIRDLRLRQHRNLVTTLLVSQGVPMLLAGDELGRSQGGNNNAYCQDNMVNWLDWQMLDDHPSGLLEFTRELVKLRQRYKVLRFSGYVHVSRQPGEPGIHWLNHDGEEMRDEHWHEHQNHLLGYLLIGESDRLAGGADKLLVIFNNGETDADFGLPEQGEETHWQLLLDTSTDTSAYGTALVENGNAARIQARSIKIYLAAIACGVQKDSNS